MKDESCIIIDNGSDSLKAGHNTNSTPTVYVPTFLGEPREKFRDHFTELKYYGDDVLKELGKMSTTSVIDHGHIEDFDSMEKLWEICFNKLDSVPECSSVLLTEPLLCSPDHRRSTFEIFFDKFGVEELNVSLTGLLATYGTGKKTATIIDIGEGMIQCVPVQDGYLDQNCARRVDFGGHELTMYLQRLLCGNGYILTSREEFQLVKSIKESLCYCSTDPRSDENRASALDKIYELPDGETLRDGETRSISLNVERFYVCEALFNPAITNSEVPSIVTTIWDSIKSCAIQQRTSLTENIHLCGGSSLFEGLDKRLSFELQNVAPPGARHKVKVFADKNRRFLSWTGALLFSDFSIRTVNSAKWTSRQEWEESGPDALSLKFQK